MIDLTIGVTLHDEPFGIAHRAVRSAKRAIEVAEMKGLSCELIITRSQTLPDYFGENGVETFSGPSSLGLKRNAVIARAGGRYVAWLDGDDVFGRDWAWRGVQYLDKTATESVVIAHPQVNIYFGAEQWWFQHIDQRDPAFDPEIFWDNNVWTSLCMAPRDLLLRHPYSADAPGFGFEDWEWHRRTVAAGCLHVVVPETVHFIRRKALSLNARSVQEKRLPAPSNYDQGDSLCGRLNSQTCAPSFKPAKIGEWLDEQWKDAHLIEAELWPVPREIEQRPMFIPDTLGASTSYRRMVGALEGFDHVILVPWLSVGGADLQALEHARAAVEAGRRVAIVCTDELLANTWAERTSAEVVVLPKLVPEKRGRASALLHSLLANRPATVHVLNSAMGWLLLREHGAAIQNHSVTFASLFCEDRMPGTVRRAGYAYDGSFSRAQPYINRVLTDNTRFQQSFYEEFGHKPALVQLPVKMHHGAFKASTRPRFLWASRFDMQKGVMLLTRIASANPGVMFDVHGAALVEGRLPPPVQAAREVLERMPNVILHKGQWSWEKLIAEQGEGYTGFIYTGQWDGMPNVVLEAAAHGLPVVSTDVGDVVNLAITVTEEASWADALSYIARERGDLIRTQRDYLAEYHNENRFFQQLEQAEYL